MLGTSAGLIGNNMGRQEVGAKIRVAGSEQSGADAVMVWPPWENWSASILVKGQGPAMHEARALRNSLPRQHPKWPNRRPPSIYRRVSREVDPCKECCPYSQF